MDIDKLSIEQVTWEDHYSTDEWTKMDDADVVGEIFVTSLGYLIKETKQKIVLAQNIATNGQIAGTITILKKTVKKRTTIREQSGT